MTFVHSGVSLFVLAICAAYLRRTYSFGLRHSHRVVRSAIKKRSFLSTDIHRQAAGLVLNRITGSLSATAIDSLSSTISDDIDVDTYVIDKEANSEAGPGIDSNETLQRFDWYKQWYPLAVEEFTDKGRPHKLQLLGHDVVLWFDGLQWRVFQDVCPHRGVPLSEGRVEETGELLCAYHAWRFDGSGRCTTIPQASSDEKEARLKNNSKSCALSHPTQLQQGVIWCWGEHGLPGSDAFLEAALKSPRLVQEVLPDHPLSREGRSKLLPWSFRDLPYGWDMFVENVLDPAHAMVTHHNVVSNRYKDPTFMDIVKTPSCTEIPISQGGTMDPLYPQDKGFRFEALTPDRDTDYRTFIEFMPPCHSRVTFAYPDESEMSLVLLATPTKPGFCRHIGCQLVVSNKQKKTTGNLFSAFALPMPKWLLHIAASFFLHQDQVFLHHQERMLYRSSNYAFGNFNGSTTITTTSSSSSSSPGAAATAAATPTPPLTSTGQTLSNPFAGLRNDHAAYSSHYFTPNEMDASVNRFRQWVQKTAGGGPLWGPAALAEGLPKLLPSAELYDVYEAHTKNCRICQTALKRIKIVRNLAIFGAVLSLRITRPLRAGLAAAACGAVAFVTHALVGLFFKYEFNHQDNK